MSGASCPIHSISIFYKEIQMSGIIILKLNDSRGVYLPQCFVEDCGAAFWSVCTEDRDILKAGPDHEWYWDAWENVLNSAVFTDDDGMRWELWQDWDEGDLFAICPDLMTAEEYKNFFGEEKEIH